jgi:hypothetical protein
LPNTLWTPTICRIHIPKYAKLWQFAVSQKTITEMDNVELFNGCIMPNAANIYNVHTPPGKNKM